MPAFTSVQNRESPTQNLPSIDEFKKKDISINNNRRWTRMSDETLKKIQNKNKYYKTALAVALIATPTLFMSFLGMSYFFYAKDLLNLTLLSFGASLGSCTWFSIVTVDKIKDYHGEKNTRLDPSQTDKVTKIFDEILNGNIRTDCRIKEFGILSEEVYSKLKDLIDEKKRIESKFFTDVNCKKPLTIDGLKKLYNTYNDDITAWNEKWDQFKPELQADLPDPSLLNEYSFNTGDDLPV